VCYRPYFPTVFLLLSAALLYAVLWHLFYAPYQMGSTLSGDDISLFTATKEGGVRAWFTQGYSRYFITYPEWFHPYTNFLRPFSNAYITVLRPLLGESVPAFAALLCAAQGLFAVFFYGVLLGANVRPLPAVLASFLVLLQPAFLHYGLFFVSFHFDLWAGYFVLLAAFLLWKQRYALAWLLLCLALLTKETALFAPLAAALYAWGRTRRRGLALFFLLPLVGWAVLRWLAFGSVFSGTYASSGLASMAISLAKGLLVWPSGLVSLTVLKDVQHEVLRDGMLPVMRTFLPWALLAQAIVALALLLAVRRMIARWRQAGAFLWENPLAVAGYWLFASLPLLLLAGHDARFGGAFYPLLILFLTLSWQAAPRQRVAQAGAIVAITLCLVVRIGTFAQLAQESIALRRQEAALHAALTALPQETSSVLIAGAPDAYTAPVYLQQYWKLPMPLTILYHLRQQGRARAQQQSVQYHPHDHTVTVDISAASGRFAFNGVQGKTIAKMQRSAGLGRQAMRYYAPSPSLLRIEGIEQEAVMLVALEEGERYRTQPVP
jgi:hypothetical protein